MGAPKGNQYAVGNNGGRPAKYDNAADLIAACEGYFEFIEGEFEWQADPSDPDKDIKIYSRWPEPATVTGLSLYLGFENRRSLLDYKGKKEFSTIIKRAISRVEHGYEKALFSDKPTGPIFALKNMGWNDKQQVEHTGKGGGPIAASVTINIKRNRDES